MDFEENKDQKIDNTRKNNQFLPEFCDLPPLLTNFCQPRISILFYMWTFMEDAVVNYRSYIIFVFLFEGAIDFYSTYLEEV